MALALKIILLITELLPLITKIIQVVEAQYGPGTGPTKKALVTGTVVDALATANAMEGLSNETLLLLVNAVVDRQVAAMNATGQLPK